MHARPLPPPHPLFRILCDSSPPRSQHSTETPINYSIPLTTLLDPRLVTPHPQPLLDRFNHHPFFLPPLQDPSSLSLSSFYPFLLLPTPRINSRTSPSDLGIRTSNPLADLCHSRRTLHLIMHSTSLSIHSYEDRE